MTSYKNLNLSSSQIKALSISQKNIFFSKADLSFNEKMLNDDWTSSDTNFIKNIFIKKLHVFPNKIIPLGNSSLHRIYIIKDSNNSYVTRINSFNSLYKRYSFFIEQWIMEKLSQNSLPYLKIIFIDISRSIAPFDYEITEFIKGDTIHDLSLNKKINPLILIELGKTVAKFHKMETRKFGFFQLDKIIKNDFGYGKYNFWRTYILKNLDNHLSFCLKTKIINQEIKEKILWLFKFYGKFLENINPVLLHGDLTNRNIFVKKNKIICIIDWEDCLSGDPIFDIAYYGTGSFHHKEWFTAFIQGYTKINSLPRDFFIRYWLYFLRISLAKAVVRYRFRTINSPFLPLVGERIEKSLKKLMRNTKTSLSAI